MLDSKEKIDIANETSKEQVEVKRFLNPQFLRRWIHFPQ